MALGVIDLWMRRESLGILALFGYDLVSDACYTRIACRAAFRDLKTPLDDIFRLYRPRCSGHRARTNS